jgi:hypothetical protein
MSRRRILDRHRAGLPTTPRGDNRSNFTNPLKNTERDAAPRLNVFCQALVQETTQSLFEPVPVLPPIPDVYPLLARGHTISAINGRSGAPSARKNASCSSDSDHPVQSFLEDSSNENRAAGADVVSPRTDVCEVDGAASSTQNFESSIDEYEYDADGEVCVQSRDRFDKSYKNKLLSESPRDKLYSFLLSRKVWDCEGYRELARRRYCEETILGVQGLLESKGL